MSSDEPGTVSSPRSAFRAANVMVVAPFLFIGLIASGKIIDNGFLWHIRAGEVQAGAQQVLTADVFSFTALGEDWRTQSWLLELGYSWAETTFGGLAWSNWMILILASTTTILLAVAAYRSTPSPISVSLVLVAVVWLMGPFMQPRPVLASYVLAAALIVIVQHRDRLAWALVPLFWVWAAVHGSWALGGLFLVLEWIRTRDGRLLRAGIAAAVATLCTAHGFGAWEIVTSFGSSRDTLSLIAEWQVPDFSSVVQGPFVLLIIGIIVAAIRGRVQLRDLITIAPFILIGMDARRTVFPATIVLLPWAALALPAIRLSVRAGSARVAKVTAVLVAILVVSPMLLRPLGVLDPERFPTQELVMALEGDRQFNGSGVGGYLMYANFPEIPVFIDDRAELYPYEHFADLQEIIAGNYRDSFANWGITVALTHRDWKLTDALVDDGWSLRAENEYFLVLGAP